jgi:HK97 family phage major capsid protein
MPLEVDPNTITDADLLALAEQHLPRWIRPVDKQAWLATFVEAYRETGDELKAALAATGRASKRRMLGLKSIGGAPVVAGWGLLFTDANDLDRQGTYFEDDTAYLLEYYRDAPLFYEHGEDPSYGVQPIGQRVNTIVYPRGIWAEHRLFTDHPLFEQTVSRVERGELAYSSDSIGHLAEKEYNQQDGRLGFWALVGWSLTGDPAEPALGNVTLTQFAGALKSAAREARTQDGAVQPFQSSQLLSGVDRMDNNLLSTLATALGLPPDASPELIESAITQAISEMDSNPEHMAAVHAAMGGKEGETPEKEALAEKMRGMYKMACEPVKQDVPATPAQPDPAMSAPQRNYDALKQAYSHASKAAPRGSGMPYQVNPQKSDSRDYSTRNFNINKGAKQPGVADVFKSMVYQRNGWTMPTGEFNAAKAMSYATGPAGGYVLQQEISDDILDPLRAQTVVLELGARQEDLDGVQIKQVPAMQSAPSAYWVGEGQSVTDSQPQYRMISLVPKPLAVLVQRPFNFFKNMTPRAESQLREQIQKSLALGIDLAALTGTGGAGASPNTGSQPVGLLNITGVTNTPLATNGRNPTPADLEGADKRLDAANIPEGGKRGWTFHTNVKHVFTGMTNAIGEPLFREAWGDGVNKPTLLGYEYKTSNQISTSVTTGSNANTSYIFYGDWSYMIVGLTTTVELVLDQTYAASLLQGLLAYVYVDIQVDYPQAFQVLSGVTYVTS